ncbi:hypothetical protein GF420_07495, partial [candidate division GN15 bacterium]|nr:hypothetical protein [candidate division GN15 bacterium]
MRPTHVKQTAMSVALALLLLGVFLTPALPAQTLAERFDQYCRAANEI